ncbi:hypothetical protein PV05_06628 [Exophiala xenobiotica]|uniref:histone acetyltransferase n=1 Tax=Exophiala xenobiotica TaxID=348802 RepID=A0A0D2F2U1_9EURO|nr:uncharacterized protein PV05_06628 [Exophiala xenobiotica]KIW54259.1 hypothetical protein PV05_06628 [Exophiala xenobiotica]
MVPASTLQSRLASILPQGLDIIAYHLSSSPASTTALFAPLPGQDEEPTICESHFLAISSPEKAGLKEVLVFAIEILIFSTPNLTTVFVSKADSSGFSSRLSASRGSPSVVAAVTSGFLDFLLQPRLNQSRVILSLFARSQNQYLFPGSIENPGKHVLDDRQLIKWWCRVLDRVLRLHSDTSDPPSSSSAHLLVPGCDKGETKAFFPPSSRQDPPSDPKWINSYPVELLVTDVAKPPRHLVPRFPDDPKSRFLDDLDGDFIDNQGRWRSIKSLDQFWEMMSYRQECSAGRLVGFLWLVFSQGQTTHTKLSELDQFAHVESLERLREQASLPTPGNSQAQENGDAGIWQQTSSDLSMIREVNSPPPSSPLEVPHDEGPSTESADANVNDGCASASVPGLTDEDVLQVHARRFNETWGELVLSTTQYQTLMDHLLQTDFAGEEKAAESTKSWIQKALGLTGKPGFGLPIQGEHVFSGSVGAEKADLQQVNVLTAVRKKRKAENIDERPASSQSTETTSNATVNILAAGLVRKKPKG